MIYNYHILLKSEDNNMPSEKARNHFLGKNGHRRLNCAQAVLAAFDVEPELIDENRRAGGGNAPEGWCGAAYGAALLLKDESKVEEFFTEHAGSVKCREIRKEGKLSCPECVNQAAQLVVDISLEKTG